MKISQNPTPNFHAARINGYFFGSSGSNSFTGVKYFIHSLWENYANITGERFRALFRSSNFFVIKNFRYVSLVLKFVTLSAQSVKKRTQNPEIPGNATGAALNANVTLGNDF